MPTLWQINDPSCVLTVLLWLGAVWALGHTLFGSYFANLLDHWIRRRFNYDFQIQRLGWELFHKCEWDREYANAQNKELVKRPRELTPEELVDRKRRYWVLYFAMWHVRLVRYFFSCPFCHYSWAALILTLAYSPARGFSEVIANALAYCGVTTIAVSAVLRADPVADPDQMPQAACPGGNCSRSQRAPRPPSHTLTTLESYRQAG